MGEAAIGCVDGSIASHLLSADHWDGITGQGGVFSSLGVSDADINQITEVDRCRFETVQLLQILPELSGDRVWIIHRLGKVVVPAGDRQGHPMHVPRRGRERRMNISVGIDPDHPKPRLWMGTTDPCNC